MIFPIEISMPADDFLEFYFAPLDDIMFFLSAFIGLSAQGAP